MEFQDNLIQFVFDTMCSQEYSFYNNFKNDTTIKLPMTLLTMQHICPILNHMASEYLNKCYSALILKNDDYVLASFKKIKDSATEIKHSYMCILHLVGGLISAFHKYMDRKNLDISSRTNYMTSFQNEFNKYYAANIVNIRHKLKHVCEFTEDIEKLDPTKKIFKVFDEEEEKEYNEDIVKLSMLFEKINVDSENKIDNTNQDKKK